MWIIVAGLAIFMAGTFLLLVLLSPKGEDRPMLFRCQRCEAAFGSPPLHPLPERYQEVDICLCPDCSGELEEKVRAQVREAVRSYVKPAD